jgi:hypothetical protein
MLSTRLSPVEAVELIAATVGAETEQLQPVLSDFVTCLLRDRLDERLNIVALEEGNLSAVLTEQQMLVTLTSRDERLTSHRLVDALDEMQLFQLFQRAVHGDKSKGTVFLACHVVHLDGGQGVVGLNHHLNYSAARFGDSITVFLQLGEPGFSGHGRSCK